MSKNPESLTPEQQGKAFQLLSQGVAIDIVAVALNVPEGYVKRFAEELKDLQNRHRTNSVITALFEELTEKLTLLEEARGRVKRQERLIEEMRLERPMCAYTRYSWEERLTNLAKPIDSLKDLDSRTLNALRRQNRYIIDLVLRSQSELGKSVGIGPKTLRQIKEVLSELDLMLGMRVPEYVVKQVQELIDANAST